MTRIICFGDSITASKGLPEGRRWSALLQKRLDEIAPDQYAVHNAGVGGDTTHLGLLRYEADVQPHLPGIVLLEFGFNDGSVPEGRHLARVSIPSFRENIAEIVRLVREKGGKAVLIANHPIRDDSPADQGNGRSYTENFRIYQPVIRELAKELDLPLIDLEKEMLDAEVDLGELLAPHDGLHLSLSGQQIYADFIFTRLKSLIRSGILS